MLQQPMQIIPLSIQTRIMCNLYGRQTAETYRTATTTVYTAFHTSQNQVS